MTQRAVKQQEAASSFFAELDIDVSYFPAIWHTYKVGQLMATDLDRVCRRHGLSMADVHLLGAARADRSRQLRATDLAQILYVSNAVLSSRIARLRRDGFLARRPCTTDRRAFELILTPKGVTTIDRAIDDVRKSASFVRFYRLLPLQDQIALARIMGELHNQLDREFISASRGPL
jgi:DNA-binding MarR family transcriptional regulator